MDGFDLGRLYLGRQNLGVSEKNFAVCETCACRGCVLNALPPCKPLSSSMPFPNRQASMQELPVLRYDLQQMFQGQLSRVGEADGLRELQGPRALPFRKGLLNEPPCFN